LLKLNWPLAVHLGLDPDRLASPEGTEILAGKRLPDGADPIAMAYAGHQFGHFVPQLGDGRAILLGEVIDADGIRRDIQLKGSGPTPFSRRGDGRAALGPVLREYVISEAMAALGIPTTRSLAAVMTGESVLRETALPGAILTRVASSHIRVGTFQYFAARGDTEGVRQLADHVIARHYPEVATTERPYHALLQGVIARQAELLARWLLIGFIHGVMNTDNTSISGETIDYGPCAFMHHYDPATVSSSLDELGLDHDSEVRQLFADPAAYDEWAARWRQRTADEPQDAATRRTAMRAVNPVFIPRNHRVEAVIEAAVNRDDFALFEELLTVLSKPYEDQPALSAYAEPMQLNQRVLQTFCGTLIIKSQLNCRFSERYTDQW